MFFSMTSMLLLAASIAFSSALNESPEQALYPNPRTSAAS